MVAITIICYLGAQVAKATSMDNKWLPVLCGVLGNLGVVGWRYMVEYPAEDILTAVAVGIVSGLAARTHMSTTPWPTPGISLGLPLPRRRSLAGSMTITAGGIGITTAVIPGCAGG